MAVLALLAPGATIQAQPLGVLAGQAETSEPPTALEDVLASSMLALLTRHSKSALVAGPFADSPPHAAVALVHSQKMAVVVADLESAVAVVADVLAAAPQTVEPPVVVVLRTGAVVVVGVHWRSLVRAVVGVH